MAKEIRLMHYDYLVVGAGLYGAVFAHEAAAARKRVLVVEKRSHIAGNVYTEEQAGIQVHRYGAHIFHTLCAARAAWRRPGWRPGSPAGEQERGQTRCISARSERKNYGRNVLRRRAPYEPLVHPCNLLLYGGGREVDRGTKAPRRLHNSRILSAAAGGLKTLGGEPPS